MQIRVIVLDFDGVMVESVGIKDKAFKTIFNRFPEKLDEIMAYHFKYNAVIRYEKFKYIYTHILKEPYTADIEKRLVKEYTDLVMDSIIQCPLVTGCKEFLEYFSAKFPLYIASINPEEELKLILKRRGLRDYFKKIYAVPWLKKDAIKDILMHEKCLSDEIIFLGDSPEDHKASMDARVNFIGRDTGKFLKDRAFPVFKDLREIKDYLQHRKV